MLTDVTSPPSKSISTITTEKILIVGLTAAGTDSLPQTLHHQITQADLLVGGRRHLGYFPDFTGETLAITANIPKVVERLKQALSAKERAVVLASGDPMCYGIGSTLRRYLPAEALHIIPAPSAFQLAFSALGEPWDDATLLSAHGRALADVIQQVRITSKAAILTDNNHTPKVIAKALIDAGVASETQVAICENLAGPDERIVRTQLDQVDQQSYASLNVFVVWNQPIKPNIPHLPGLPDNTYSTSANQITKREVRLYGLAELALGPQEVMWDIGAGSGSVSLEAARMQPTAKVYAVEKRAELCQHLAENLRRFPAPNLQWTEGVAPEACEAWADPHCIFIGGSAGRLGELIDLAKHRLHPNGRLVINLVTLDNLQLIRDRLPDAQIVQSQFNRAVPILETIRFEAINPVYVVSWRK